MDDNVLGAIRILERAGINWLDDLSDQDLAKVQERARNLQNRRVMRGAEEKWVRNLGDGSGVSCYVEPGSVVEKVDGVYYRRPCQSSLQQMPPYRHITLAKPGEDHMACYACKLSLNRRDNTPMYSPSLLYDPETHPPGTLVQSLDQFASDSIKFLEEESSNLLDTASNLFGEIPNLFNSLFPEGDEK